MHRKNVSFIRHLKTRCKMNKTLAVLVTKTYNYEIKNFHIHIKTNFYDSFSNNLFEKS